MKYLVIIISCLSNCLIYTPIVGQTIEGYSTQRALINQHIGLLDKNLKARETERYSMLQRYDLTQNKIDQRESLISLIKEEIVVIEDLQNRTTAAYSLLSKELSHDQEQLAKILRHDFYQDLIRIKNGDQISEQTLIELSLRDRYMAHIRDRLLSDMSIMDRSQSIIRDSIKFLTQLKEDKLYLLNQEELNINALRRDINQNENLLSSIQEEEARLKENLLKQKAEQLRITNYIKGYMGSATPPATPTASNVTPKGFAGKKKNLSWPVSNGLITNHFGVKEHASLSNVKVENNGIDMLCDPSSDVQSVYDGIVILVREQSPYGYIVIINHGDYTTAYYNLKKVFVDSDSKIKEGQNIGQLSTESSGAPFHFEIWYDQNHIDPEEWLRNR